jgi:hypothetical protein
LNDIRAVICMPSNRMVPAETVESLARVYGRGLVDGTVTALLMLSDTFIDAARNLLVTQAVDVPTQPTHILWMDDDNVIPSDTVARLAAHKVPIVGGLYHQRLPPFAPVAYRTVEGRKVQMIDLPDDPHGLVRVDGLGLGCTLVEIGIYLAMAERYGDARWHAVVDGRGEDIWFFERVQEMGIPVYLDTDARCGHVRRETVGTVHYESYRRAAMPKEDPRRCSHVHSIDCDEEAE